MFSKTWKDGKILIISSIYDVRKTIKTDIVFIQ